MKKLIAAVFIGLAGMAYASDNDNILSVNNDSFAGDLTNQTALAYSKTYTYDLAQYGIKKVSAEVISGTSTLPAITFTDGQVSTGTITVSASPIALLCGTIVKVNGVSFNFGGCPPYDSRTATLVTIGANVTAAAANLCRAISYTNSATAAISTCTTSSGVITIKSKLSDGVNYALTTSSTFTAVGGTATGAGVAATYSATNDTITKANTFSLALPVLYSQGTNAISGLTDQTTYYAIPVSNLSVFKLATSKVNAIAGTAVDFTIQLASAAASTYTLTPLEQAGSPAYTWQASNDNSNYFTLVSSATTASTVSISAGADVVNNWNFGDYPWKYLRMNVTGPTQGGIKLNTWLYLKR